MLETKHRGYEIKFREYDEEWDCRDLGLHDKSLKALKAKIDRLSRAGRSLGIAALKLHRDYRSDNLKISEIQVTTLCEVESNYRNGGRDEIVQCWIKKDGERHKINIDQIYPVTSRQDLEAYVRRVNEHDSEGRKLQAMLAEIGAFNADSISLAAKEADAA